MPDSRPEYSQRRLQELEASIDPVHALLGDHRLCVYATGSYGRMEAWSGSDIDLFFLYDDADESTRLPWTVFVQLAAHLIKVTADMGFPPFSGDGKYLEIQYVREMGEVLGSARDDSLNTFTARMLLLLESHPLYRQDVHLALLERIIGFYYRDYEDHTDTFLPTFLVNDILRFWRTLTLNYEHHRLKLLALTDEQLQRKKAESALKNYKLKVSRQATCYSMVANLSTEQPPVRPQTVLDLCRMTPSQRFERLRAHDGADGLVQELVGEYEQFLHVTQRPEPELLELFVNPTERKQALARAKTYGDLIYRLLKQVVPEERMRSLVV
jgi:predicted nucleotidyltransferase